MTNFEQDPHISYQAKTLAIFQHDGQQVMINMKTDEETGSSSHYYGMIDRIILEDPEPYVDIRAEKLVIAYFTQTHLDAKELFDALRAAREAALESESTANLLLNDMVLMDAIEAELNVVHDEQTIELSGIPQRIAISGINMTFGLGRP